MLNEHALCLRWCHRRFNDRALHATDGRRVGVVYPGRWCRTPGPDFRDAVLLFDDDLRHGDVEVHRYASDWKGHGHHLQASYNRVILQVVLENDAAENTLTQDGAPVPTVSLPASDDPNNPPPPTCPAAAARWDVPSLASLLENLGQERVLARAARLEAALTLLPPEQVLWEAFGEALGYRANAAPFRALTKRLPLALLEAAAGGLPCSERHLVLEALLLGASGLLPSLRRIPTPDGYAAEVEAAWDVLAAQWALQPMPAGDWRFAQVRPENWPTRRVAAAAWLIDRHWAYGLLEAMLGVARAGPRALELALVGGEESSYWNAHYDFGRPKRPSHLIGQARAAELAVNAVLPLAHAWGQWRGDEGLCQAALCAVRQYPARGANELTRYMAQEVLRTPIRPSACRQQGLLHLYHRWCRDKSCAECPIAA